MRIAQVTPVYPPDRGGMARVACEYTDRLRARGHDVHVFSPQTVNRQHDAGHVHRIPPSLRVGNASLLPSLASRLAGFDIVHVHYPFYGGAEPIAWARSAGRIPAVVLTYHMDASADGLKGAMFELHREMLQPWILSHANRVLVSSRDYADSSALARTEEALNRIDVCPFGVDSVRFQPGDESTLRTELGIDERTPVLLFVGALDAAHRFKGLDVLLVALASLRGPQWSLVVVGDGDERSRFQNVVRGLGLESRIAFAGDVSDELLPRYYRLADLHVLPSTSRAEAFGLVTLEAAACGLPSIVSDLPGVRANVIDGTTGLVVPPADANALASAIDRLLRSPEYRRSLGGHARLRVEREYRWEPLIEQLDRIYEAVLHSGN
jgi:glycosyltransferase involved in cell wall biosynthesis